MVVSQKRLSLEKDRRVGDVQPKVSGTVWAEVIQALPSPSLPLLTSGGSAMSNRSKMHDPWGHGAAYDQGAKERSRLSLRTTGESIMGNNSPIEGGSPHRKYLSPAKRAHQQERQQVIDQREPPTLGRSTSDRLSVGNSEMMAALSLTRHRSVPMETSMERKSSFVFEADRQNPDARSDHSAGSTLDWGRRPVSLQDQIKEKVAPRLALMAVCRSRVGA